MRKRFECMLETLTSCIENQLTHLESVDTKEMGEAIDMIKDLEEAMYYCTIIKAMEERDESRAYYPVVMDKEKMRYEEEYDKKMMHDDPAQKERWMREGMKEPWHEKDAKEGRSPKFRRNYMEAKTHHDKAIQMKELETYMQELTGDIVEMVEGSTQEEKQYLSKKIAALANKIQQLND